ncbi:MAG: hypothetical protein JJP05_08220 [cyanobacterium endosymbiont of Rhopalodia gibba]|jgi:hypothetical protein
MTAFCSNPEKEKEVCQSGTEHLVNPRNLEAIQVIENYLNFIISTVNVGIDELKYTLSKKINCSLKIENRQLI